MYTFRLFCCLIFTQIVFCSSKILQAWLERAENAAKAKKEVDGYNGNEKKRKRTSIAAPEKRSLEAYFTVQPR